VAGSTGERQQEDGIGIVLTTDKDEETVRNERLKEAEAKKAQNIMPLWHLRSTITNDLTALGVKEKAQNAAAAQQVAGPSNLNLDESLKGLGKVGRAKDQVTTPEDAVDEDEKPGVTAEGNEADCKFVPPSFLFANRKELTPPFFFPPLPPPHSTQDYDQYYASLAASAAPSTQHTPSGEFSILGDFEEDRKSNIEYLDPLNEHNKRSRSVEDEGDAERKQARVGTSDGWDDQQGQGAQENGEPLSMNGVEGLGLDAGDMLATEDDPIVYGLFFHYILILFQACSIKSSFQWMAIQYRSPRLGRSITI